MQNSHDVMPSEVLKRKGPWHPSWEEVLKDGPAGPPARYEATVSAKEAEASDSTREMDQKTLRE